MTKSAHDNYPADGMHKKMRDVK